MIVPQSVAAVRLNELLAAGCRDEEAVTSLMRLGRAVQHVPFVGFDGNDKIKACVDKSARSGAKAVNVEKIRAWFDGERLYALYRLCTEAMLELMPYKATAGVPSGISAIVTNASPG